MRFFLLLALPLAAGACGGQAFEVASTDAGEDNAVGDGGNPADTGGPDTSPSDATMSPDVRDAGKGPDTGGSGDGGGCPIPATIASGGDCPRLGLVCPSAAPVYVCGTSMVNGYSTCTCSIGTKWACPAPTCVEAGAPPPTCPGPANVVEGRHCASQGQDCPGVSTACAGGGMTFYDVYQCTPLLLWTRIVTTVCADGG